MRAGNRGAGRVGVVNEPAIETCNHTMDEVDAYEAKTHLAQLLKRAGRGERFTITMAWRFADEAVKAAC